MTENVQKGSILMTDDFAAYGGVSSNYDHRIVLHSAKEYACGIDFDTHCNGIEGYWAHVRRMYRGIHHFFSPKHMNLYIASQSFRFNHKDESECQRLRSTLTQTIGKRITYKDLTKEDKSA